MAKMYYTETEAAEKLGVTVDYLATLVGEQKLRLFKDGMRNMYMASEVDVLVTETEGEEEEVELTPVVEEPEGLADVVESEKTPGPAAGEDAAVTPEGVSIFDDEDLEIEIADPMAKTKISPSVEDQIAIEGVGSGSGLLDLTRESDDTSLGEVIDHIDLDESSAERTAMPATAYGEPAIAPETAVVVAEAPEVIDATTGLLSGFLVGCLLVVLFLGAVTLALASGEVPQYIAALKANVAMLLVGAVVLVGVFGVIGMFIGKSIAARQQAIQEMGR